MNKLVILAESQYLQTNRLLLELMKLTYFLDYHVCIFLEESLTHDLFPLQLLTESKKYM